MIMDFSKYHGFGNDFIVVDNRNSCHDNILRSQRMRCALCCRRTGIGADGILEMQLSTKTDCVVKMMYYNADGNEGSFCGNGARCFTALALGKGIQLSNGLLVFEAYDGMHRSWRDEVSKLIHLEMSPLSTIRLYRNGDFFVDTGSPHHVRFTDDVEECNVKNVGRHIAWGVPYSEKGANVNFVQITPDGGLFVRTYERGVEDETLACGTGLTAVAVVNHYRLYGNGGTGTFHTKISCYGGTAEVSFTKLEGQNFSDITLAGPACHVFDGVFNNICV